MTCDVAGVQAVFVWVATASWEGKMAARNAEAGDEMSGFSLSARSGSDMNIVLANASEWTQGTE